MTALERFFLHQVEVHTPFDRSKGFYLVFVPDTLQPKGLDYYLIDASGVLLEFSTTTKGGSTDRGTDSSVTVDPKDAGPVMKTLCDLFSVGTGLVAARIERTDLPGAVRDAKSFVQGSRPSDATFFAFTPRS